VAQVDVACLFVCITAKHGGSNTHWENLLNVRVSVADMHVNPSETAIVERNHMRKPTPLSWMITKQQK